MQPADKRERLRQFEVLCRERGLSLTVQRRVILQTVLDQTDHPTADQVYERVREHVPGVSRTTVYRVLETLVEIGVITKACSPGVGTRFDPVMERHHHLVCMRCERLIDLDDRAVRYRVDLPAGAGRSFSVEDFSIHFRGWCAACRRATSRRHAPVRKRPSKR